MDYIKIDDCKLFCKKCNKVISPCDLVTVFPKTPKQIAAVPDCYKGYASMKMCSGCETVIDYKDLRLDCFFMWWSDCDKGKEASLNLKEKAFVRYFGLDKILELKKDAGD